MRMIAKQRSAAAERLFSGAHSHLSKLKYWWHHHGGTARGATTTRVFLEAANYKRYAHKCEQIYAFGFTDFCITFGTRKHRQNKRRERLTRRAHALTAAAAQQYTTQKKNTCTHTLARTNTASRGVGVGVEEIHTTLTVSSRSSPCSAYKTCVRFCGCWCLCMCVCACELFVCIFKCACAPVIWQSDTTPPQ